MRMPRQRERRGGFRPVAAIAILPRGGRETTRRVVEGHRRLTPRWTEWAAFPATEPYRVISSARQDDYAPPPCLACSPSPYRGDSATDIPPPHTPQNKKHHRPQQPAYLQLNDHP